MVGRKSRMDMQTRSGDQPLPILTVAGSEYHLNAIHNAAWSAGQWASTLLRQTGSVFGGTSGRRSVFLRLAHGIFGCPP